MTLDRAFTHPFCSMLNRAFVEKTLMTLSNRLEINLIFRTRICVDYVSAPFGTSERVPEFNELVFGGRVEWHIMRMF